MWSLTKELVIKLERLDHFIHSRNHAEQDPKINKTMETSSNSRTSNSEFVAQPVINTANEFTIKSTLKKSFGTGNFNADAKLLTISFAREAIQPKSKLFICTYCGASFKLFRSLKYHKAKLHIRGESYACKTCPKVFFGRVQLQIHEKTHGPPTKQCQECLTKFATNFGLQRHVSRVHRNERPVTCSICATSFRQGHDLKKHVATKHRAERPFTCSICQASFKLPSYLNTHHQAVHAKLKPFSCEYCGNTFTRYGGLVEHIRFHTKETPFPCKACHLSFRTASALRDHKQSKTHQSNDPSCITKPKLNHCSDCSAVFRKKSELKVHRDSVHKLGESFHCKLCGKLIYGLSLFKKHEKYHMRSKNFECEECPLKFVTAAQLKFHVSRVHRIGPPLFVCTICQKQFTRSFNLRKHQQRVHTC